MPMMPACIVFEAALKPYFKALPCCEALGGTVDLNTMILLPGSM